MKTNAFTAEDYMRENPVLCPVINHQVYRNRQVLQELGIAADEIPTEELLPFRYQEPAVVLTDGDYTLYRGVTGYLDLFRRLPEFDASITTNPFGCLVAWINMCWHCVFVLRESMLPPLYDATQISHPENWVIKHFNL